MDEFALIRRHFAALTPASGAVVLGIGDDCALLQPPPGEWLAVSSDTLVEGRHFPLVTAAADIGWKALAVNVSDLAAMGAQPLGFTLALTLPPERAADEAWLAGFAAGLREQALASGIPLVGGDTTRGPLSLTLTVFGSVPPGQALRRDGAQPGDWVCVTGTLGDAALGLERLKLAATHGEGGESACAQTLHDEAALRRRLDRPTPRLATGLALRGLASAAIDLSDGLAGDLAHLLAASGVGAELQAQHLPMSDAFARQVSAPARLALQAAGGDDYELCVCVPPEHLAEAQQRAGVALTPIGRIVAEPGLRWLDAAGHVLAGPQAGYRHF